MQMGIGGRLVYLDHFRRALVLRQHPLRQVAGKQQAEHARDEDEDDDTGRPAANVQHAQAGAEGQEVVEPAIDAQKHSKELQERGLTPWFKFDDKISMVL